MVCVCLNVVSCFLQDLIQAVARCHDLQKQHPWTQRVNPARSRAVFCFCTLPLPQTHTYTHCIPQIPYGFGLWQVLITNDSPSDKISTPTTTNYPLHCLWLDEAEEVQISRGRYFGFFKLRATGSDRTLVQTGLNTSYTTNCRVV